MSVGAVAQDSFQVFSIPCSVLLQQLSFNGPVRSVRDEAVGVQDTVCVPSDFEVSCRENQMCNVLGYFFVSQDEGGPLETSIRPVDSEDSIVPRGCEPFGEFGSSEKSLNEKVVKLIVRLPASRSKTSDVGNAQVCSDLMFKLKWKTLKGKGSRSG